MPSFAEILSHLTPVFLFYLFQLPRAEANDYPSSVHILTQLQLLFFAAGEAGEQLGSESPPTPEPWFLESVNKGAVPSTTGTLLHFVGWNEGWG